MSTRCQLRFVRTLEAGQTADPADPVAQVYTHSDGYPSGVLKRLQELKQLLEATTSVRGPSYAAAQYVFLEKLASLTLYLDPDREARRRVDAHSPADVCQPSRMQHLSQPLFLLGHGIEDPRAGIHGDEEYLYIVAIPPYELGQIEPPHVAGGRQRAVWIPAMGRSNRGGVQRGDVAVRRVAHGCAGDSL